MCYQNLNHPNITNFRRIELVFMNVRNEKEANEVVGSYMVREMKRDAIFLLSHLGLLVVLEEEW